MATKTSTTTSTDVTSATAPGLLVIEPGTWPLRIDPDPRTLIVDPEFNIRGIRLDKGFVSSIRENGVLQTIVAVRTSEGNVKVRMGNRRTLGAIEADRPTVPVEVVGDESTDEAGEIERIINQFVENKHRDAMTQAEEIGAMVQLTAFGVSAAKIAKKFSLKNGTEVKNAIKVNDSALAMEAIASYELDITEALAVQEFEDDPEAVKALMTARANGTWDNKVQSLRDVRTRRQQEDVFVASQLAAGVRVVADDDTVTQLDDLIDAEGEALTEHGHRECPGHAAIVDQRHGYVDVSTGRPLNEGQENEGRRPQETDENAPHVKIERRSYPVLEWVCTDAETQGHTARPRPTYTSYQQPARRKLADMSAEEATAARAEAREVRTNNAEWRTAETVRREWLRTYLTRKTPPKGHGVFVATAMAIDTATASRIGGNHLAAEVLGGAEPGYGRSAHIAALIEKASEQRAQVITLAIVLCGYEDETTVQSWKRVSATTTRYLAFLERCGYTLSNVERLACGREPLSENGPDESDPDEADQLDDTAHTGDAEPADEADRLDSAA